MSLKDIYYDPSTGYRSAQKLEGKASLEEKTAFVNNQEGHQLTRQRKTYKKNFIHIVGELGTYQIDLMFFEEEKVVNRNRGIFLVGIEINTRYLTIVPLKTKTALDVLQGFCKLYIEAPDQITPCCITSDNGSEFKNKLLTDLCEQLTITQYFAQPDDHHKMGIVDRVIRTFRELIGRYRASNNTKKFIGVLQELVKNYNTTPHDSLNGKTPTEALGNLPELADIRGALKEESAPGLEAVSKATGQVRIARKKGVFEKGTGRSYSADVATVEGRSGNRVLVDGRKVAVGRLQSAPLVEKAPARKSDAVLHQQVREVKASNVNKFHKSTGVHTKNIIVGRRMRRPVVRFSPGGERTVAVPEPEQAVAEEPRHEEPGQEQRSEPEEPRREPRREHPRANTRPPRERRAPDRYMG